MNILFAVSVWPNLYTTYFFHEVAWLKRRGHSVAVVSMKSNGSSDPADLHHFGLDDIPVLQLEGGPNEPASLKAVQRLIQIERLQIVYAQVARDAAELALRLHQREGIPYVIRLHGGDVHSRLWPALGQILENASAICPVSEYLADLLLRRQQIPETAGLPVNINPEKVSVCPNGIPAEIIAGEPATQSNTEPLIGTIGRLSPLKRHSDILEAAAGLAAEFPELRVCMVGGGELRGQLELRAQQLGIANRTEITGPLQWPAVLQRARDFSVYVQASEREGFCVASVEAAAQGLPLVLSRTGIHEECVSEGLNGYLFTPGNVEDMREHLRSVLDAGGETRRRMGAASLEIVRRKFTLDHTMPRIESILELAGQGDSLRLAGVAASQVM